MRRHAALASLVAFLALGVLSPAPASAGGPITSGQSVTGSVSGPSFAEVWTFTGTTGDRIVISAAPTGGTLVTQIHLSNPSSVEVLNTGNTQIDYKLLATGTYTLTIQDGTLSHSGTYSLTFLDVTSGPLTYAGDLDGGPIASAAVVTGNIDAVSDMDAFTFTGTAGNRVVIGAVATSGLGFNTTLLLYPPGGGAAEVTTYGGDQIDTQLAASGTYTLVVSDYLVAHTGGYSIAYLNLSTGPLTSVADPEGGPIGSAEVRSGHFQTTPDFDAYTFSGAAGDRIVITTAPTGGTSQPLTSLYPPGGGAAVISSSSTRIDLQLTTTGTYTILLNDLGLNDTGSYDLSLLDVTSGPWTTASDPDGSPISSAGVYTGQMNADVDMDAFTFTATAGDRVLLGVVATGGSGFNTDLNLYPPGGGPAEVSTYGGDRIDTRVLKSGVYTLVIEDYSLAHTGTYSLSYVNLNGPTTSIADPDGGPIASAQILTGQFQTAPDFDVYRFTCNPGNRMIVDAVPTGGTANPFVSIYPPGGGAAVATTGSHRLEYQALVGGTYTLVLEDTGLNDTGSYSVTLLNVTEGPLASGTDPDGGPIVSAVLTTGQINANIDMDAFTFSGTAGDRVVLDALATSGTGFNTTVTLYPPGGGPAEVTSYGSDRVDTQLQQTGTYTAVIEDYSNTNPGTYSLMMLNLTAGPITSAGDPDGGTIASGEIKSGHFQTAPDFDVWRFTVAAGNRVVIDAVPTSGTANPLVYIYPPGGGAPVVTSGSHRVEYQAPAAGTYTLLLEDQGLNDTGAYDVTLLNVTAGPLTTVADPDGGPIVSAQVTTGQINADVDMDAFTFNGTHGDRVVLGALATSGTGFNTTMTLYPPGGGPAEALSYGGDRLDIQLQQTGTYTVVIEDYSNTYPGAYSLMLLDMTAGPITSAGDPDGGTIVSGEVKTGQFQTTPDFDVYRFTSAVGNRVILDAVPTGGTANPLVYIYPPGGGAPVVASGAHRVEYQTLATGTYTVLLEDQGLNDTGSYDLTLLNVTAGPLTTVADPDGGTIASAEVKAGQINVDVDMDAFKFAGTAGDEVVIGAVQVGGGLLNTIVTLYPPDGGAAEASSYGADRLDTQLQESGNYTIVVEDYGNAHAGNYSLSLLNLRAGPLTSVADPDGGYVEPGDTKSGQFQTVPDFDAFRFAGAFGDTVRVTTTATLGSITPMIWIYPPSGASLVATTASPYSYVLPSTAIFTLLIQDATLLNTGSYSLHYQKSGSITGVTGPGTPTALALAPAAPNPFGATTDVRFDLPEASPVTLRVFDVRGSLVRVLADGRFAPGRQHVRWDGRDARGGPAPSGMYWVELRAGGEVLRRKVVRVE